MISAREIVKIVQAYIDGYEIYEGDSLQELKKCKEEPKWNFEDKVYQVGFSKASLTKRINIEYDRLTACFGVRRNQCLFYCVKS